MIESEYVPTNVITIDKKQSNQCRSKMYYPNLVWTYCISSNAIQNLGIKYPWLSVLLYFSGNEEEWSLYWHHREINRSAGNKCECHCWFLLKVDTNIYLTYFNLVINLFLWVIILLWDISNGTHINAYWCI